MKNIYQIITAHGNFDDYYEISRGTFKNEKVARRAFETLCGLEPLDDDTTHLLCEHNLWDNSDLVEYLNRENRTIISE